MPEEFEKSWKFYILIIDQIKFSDTKAAAILAINGVIYGLILRNIFEIMQTIPENNIFIISSLIIGTLYGILSIIFCILCLFPKTANDDNSIFFYGHVGGNYNTFKEYEKDFDKTMKKDQLLNLQLKKQIYEVSNIALDKYKRVKLAMLSLGLAVVFLMVPLMILFGKVYLR